MRPLNNALTMLPTVLILARAGSKGLPGKNMLPLAGKPCAQWTIEHALQQPVGLVAVSTDDEKLIALTRTLRADVSRPSLLAIERPPELAGDLITIDAAARHAITVLEREHAALREPDHPIAILYANVPVRPADLTRRALRTLVDQGFDSVQSYAPVGKHHPWWTARLDDANDHAVTGARVRPWEGDVLNHGVFRRQDLPPAYIPDGGVIAVRREALMLELGANAGVREGPHAFLGREDRRGGVVSGPRGDEVVDIDSRIDLLVAEAILNERDGSR